LRSTIPQSVEDIVALVEAEEAKVIQPKPGPYKKKAA